MDSVETIIIGAGVIGLAVARQLALQGQDVLILEATNTIGSVTTARNSCVIHAGIYYAPASAKAPHCIAGRDALYQYLAERQLPHQRCGKLIVATNTEQIARLQEIEQRAIANGVLDLQWLDTAGVHAKEPAIRGVAGLFSPSTGIVDVHELIHSFLGDAENHGAMLALHCPVTAVQVQENGFLVSTGCDNPTTLHCRNLINAAGLGAQMVAHKMTGLSSTSIPLRTLAKGNYFSLQGAQPFSHLVYPVPEIGGLGIHATLDLAGKVRFGPDVEWVEIEDYSVNPARAESFYAAIRRYWPELPDGALQPDYCGIRPKTNLPNHGDTDFVIQSQRQHGIPRLINLYGIESPGLTASLSLAASVAELLHG